MRVTCDSKGCHGEAIVKTIENMPKGVKGIGSVLMWYYNDGFGHIIMDEIRIDARIIAQGGPHLCPRCMTHGG